MKRTLAIFTAMLLAGLMTPPPSSAQGTDDSGPALGVARISLTNGDVTTKRGDSGDWVAATVNTPLVEGDLVETGPGARVEIQLDYSNLIRLDGSSTLELADLGDRRFRVRLLDGRATYSELRDGEADVDIETPFVAVRPQKNGRYEIETRPGETVVQVRRGEAEVVSPDGTERVNKGKMLVIRQGSDEGLEVRQARAEPSGEWDDWNERRDERLTKSESYRYVSRSVTGADDPTTTATGITSRDTATAGTRASALAGRPIAPAAGLGSTTTAGPGSATSLGAGRRITTGAGSITPAAVGAGGRALFTTATTGGPHWWPSSATPAATSRSASGSATAT